MDVTRTLASATILWFVVAVLGNPAAAQHRAGTGWIFSGSQDYEKKDKLDLHHQMKAHRGRLKGSSCCALLVVAFPTDDTFSLRDESYEIATGTVQVNGKKLTLQPDESSREALLWWLENELESFWNAGVFDLDLSVWLTQLSGVSIKLKVKSNGEGQTGTMKLTLRFRGDIRSFDVARVRKLSRGPVQGKATFKERMDSIMSLQDLDEYYPGYPLPPIQTCEEKDAAADDFEDEFDALGLVTAPAWRGPDYCR